MRTTTIEYTRLQDLLADPFRCQTAHANYVGDADLNLVRLDRVMTREEIAELPQGVSPATLVDVEWFENPTAVRRPSYPTNIEVLQREVARLMTEAEVMKKALREQLADQPDPRVTAAAVIFTALTGREQPMHLTAEDVIAELQLLVDTSSSDIWATPPVPVTLTYIVTVTGRVDTPNRDPVVLAEELRTEFMLGTTANCRFADFSVGAVTLDEVQYHG